MRRERGGAMGRVILVVAAVLGFFVVFLPMTGCVVIVEAPARLAAGAVTYPFRVLPAVRFDLGAVATFVVALVLVAFFGHHLARHLALELDPPRTWTRRHTGLALLALGVTFLATIGTVALAHQVGWLVGSTEPVVTSSWKETDFLMQRACLERSWGTADQGENSPPPDLVGHPRLHAVVGRLPDGGRRGYVFPRDPVELEAFGGRECVAAAGDEDALDAATLRRELARIGVEF